MKREILIDAVKNSPLSKLKIAERCGLSRTTLDNILSGADAKISTIESLCNILQIDVSKLFGESALDIHDAKQAIYDLTMENLRLKRRIGELEGKKHAV